MTPARLILLLLLILIAVVLVVVVLRRGSEKRDAHRAEAAGLRSEAENLAATAAGQGAFADQAAQRAEVARVEAEEKAREAARLEAEAAQHRATVEATQREYEATMRRADDIDPDVKESAFPAVAESGGRHAAAAADGHGEAAGGGHADAAEGGHGDGEHGDAGDGGLPATRAERREAREADAEAGWAAPAAASSSATAGATGAAAARASARAAQGDDDRGQESERIASAADFRDEVPDEQGGVYGGGGSGNDSDMSDASGTDTQQSTRDDDGHGAGEGAAAGAAGAGGAYAATRAMHDDEQAEARESTDGNGDSSEHRTVGDGSADDADGNADRAELPADDLSREVESPRGEWGGPPQNESAEMTIVEPEAYATTEPVLAADQSAPVSPDAVDVDDEGSAHDGVDHDDIDRSPSEGADKSDEERFDPTPTGDWAADEGELLEENADRGDRLEAERADLAAVGDSSTDDGAASHVTGGETASHGATDGTASVDADAPPASQARRISAFEELRDGGFGVGSAAPLDDRAQPLDHPVQAFHDMTYRLPGDAGYDADEPDVWFYDEGAAQRSGFRHADG